MKLSKSELKKREDIVKGMKQNKRDLTKKYGKDAEAIMYGRATKLAKKLAEDKTKNKDIMNEFRLREMIKDALLRRTSLNEIDIEAGEDRYETEGKLKQASSIMAELEKQLKAHDWYYMMSDYSRVFDRGVSQIERIHDLMKELRSLGYDEEAKDLFNQYKPKDIY